MTERAEDTGPILSARDLSKAFPVSERRGLKRRKYQVHAVENVSFDLARGETLGIVGESGCGKTSLARTLIALETPSGGSIKLAGHRVDPGDPDALRTYRRAVQMIFQDPYAAVNPRMTVTEIVEEPLLLQRPDLNRAQRTEIVRRLLEEVSLGEDHLNRSVRGMSGGQLQRIGIARALTLDPNVLICDEPVSALDVSIQAQVLALLAEIRKKHGLSMIFISHDLSVVRQVCDRVAVMYLGRMVEIGPTKEVLVNPANPYTRALLSSEPRLQRKSSPRQRVILKGDPPSPVNKSGACVFRSRCWKAQARCEVQPDLTSIEPDHYAACYFPETEPSAIS